MDDLKQLIISGNRRALGRALTLLENQRAAGRQLLSSLAPRIGRAMIIGITGPPGAGKSTLVSELTKVLRRGQKTVGVIAVDPSSPVTQGAILGDRVRMAEHHEDPGVFIRSMASRGQLGGVAEATREAVTLLDAAGFDVVLIETVGVGQSEIEIARLADVTVLVLAPGFGDEVQMMKAGIMEIADVFAINKADLPGADRLIERVRDEQHVAAVCRVVATEGEGIEELAAAIGSAYERRRKP